jgi:hypothetical protein
MQKLDPALAFNKRSAPLVPSPERGMAISLPIGAATTAILPLTAEIEGAAMAEQS